MRPHLCGVSLALRVWVQILPTLWRFVWRVAPSAITDLCIPNSVQCVCGVDMCDTKYILYILSWLREFL